MADWGTTFLDSYNRSKDRTVAMAEAAAEAKFKTWVENNKIKSEQEQGIAGLAGKGILPAPTNTAEYAQAMGKGQRPFSVFGKQFMSKPSFGEGKPVFTIENGQLVQVGDVPKGSQVLSPTTMLSQEDKIAGEVKAQKLKNIETQNVKRKVYKKDLQTFLAIDDILQKSRGKGLGRLSAGGKMSFEGFTQGSPLGQAVASHDAASKRLRVQLVRAAGDVGNINIVEQKAAEMMIPSKWDSQETANIKRAYLQQIGQAIDSGDGNAVKDILNKFIGTPAYQAELVTIVHNGKTYKIPKEDVPEFKKDMGIK